MALQPDLWQPAALLFPDAELAMIQGTRRLMAGFEIADIGREQPAKTTTAVTWNRVGGADPDALMKCRVYAPTPFEVTALARELAARLPLLVKLGLGVVAVFQNEGPTDLGDVPGVGPMRQMLYDVMLHGQPVPDPTNH